MKSKMNIKSIIIFAILVTVGLMFLNMSLAANTVKAIVETVNVREEASSESKIVEQMSEGEEGELLENQGEWCKVKYNNTTGYVKTELLNIAQTQNNTTNESNNNITEKVEETKPVENTTEQTQNTANAETYIVIETSKLKLVPLINATDMYEVKKDEKVNVIKTMNGWAYIETDKTRGWISLEKIKTEAQVKTETQAAEQEKAEQTAEEQKEADKTAAAIKTMYVKSETVNLRGEASTDSEIVGRLPQNTRVEVLANDEGGWTKCRASGLVGYISTQYLSDEKIEVETTSRSSTSARETTTTTVASTGNGSSVVSYAEQFIGTPYSYGGTSPETGFDCSGFTSYVYSNFGVSLPRTSGGQSGVGEAVSDGNYEAGDLVVYSGHVAIYVGDGQVIHSPKPGKSVSIVPIDQAASGSYTVRRVM